MKEERPRVKYDKIGLLIWFLPMLALPMFASEINIPRIVGQMMLTFMGGTIGLTLFWLTKEKSTQTKGLTLGLLIVGLIGFGVYSSNRTESDGQNLQTCKVCGYMALKIEGDECKICMTEINEAYRIVGEYESLDQLIIEEQLDFFTSDTYGRKHSFYKPKMTTSIIDKKKYSKDSSWKPIVSKKDLEEYVKSNEEIN